MIGLTMLSVPCNDGILTAIVPEFPIEAHRRLMRDDAIWRSPEVYQHWSIKIDPSVIHGRPSNKIIFKFN